jgi:hypothetical protein
MEAVRDKERAHGLEALADTEQRLLARTIRIARHEPGEAVSPLILDAVLMGRLPRDDEAGRLLGGDPKPAAMQQADRRSRD